MSVAEFPNTSVSGSNPKPTRTYQLPDAYQVTTTEYDDGGKDYALQVGGVGIMMWQHDYETLTTAEAAILDAWAATTFYSPDEGSSYGFNYRDPWTAVLYSNVHLAPGGYVRGSHKIRTIQNRKVILVRHP